MTDERTLCGCHILVVEDEYLIAEQLQIELEEKGAIVIGPLGSLDDALVAIATEQTIDGAILDVNLDGMPIFPAAQLLLERDVPVVFTTGYDASTIPAAFRHVMLCQKPVPLHRIVAAIGSFVRS